MLGWVVRPYFFENNAGNAVIVNGERCPSMIIEFVWPILVGTDLDEMVVGRGVFFRTRQPVSLPEK